VSRVTLTFGTDGTFRESTGSSSIQRHFDERRAGELVVIGEADTATVTNGTMRVVLSTNCAHEELIAQALR
jgi:hypothetical protein